MSAPPVKKVGNGMSLGLSPTMMKFFNLPGPFIGEFYTDDVVASFCLAVYQNTFGTILVATQSFQTFVSFIILVIQ